MRKSQAEILSTQGFQPCRCFLFHCPLNPDSAWFRAGRKAGRWRERKGKGQEGKKGKGLGSPGGRTADPETDSVDADAGVEPAAVRGATVPRIDDPGSATPHS